MRNILILALTFFTLCSKAQVNGIWNVSPLTVVDSSEIKFATLGYTRNWFTLFNKRYAYYRSDAEGNVFKGGYFLNGTKSNDSLTTVAALPTGWDAYQVPCIINDGDQLAYWNVDGLSYELRAREFNDSLWVTQVIPSSNDEFAVRAKNIFERGDVVFVIDSINTSSCLNLFAGGETAIGGLVEPATWTTPAGYTLYYASDSTKIYTNGTPPSTPDVVTNYNYKDGKQYLYDVNGNPTLVMDLEMYEVGGDIYIRDNVPTASFTSPLLGVNTTNTVIKWIIQGETDLINNTPNLASGYNISAYRGRPLQITKAYVNTTTQGVPQMLTGYVYVPNQSNTLETYTVLAAGDTLFYAPDSYSLPANGSPLATFAQTFPDEVYDTGAIKAIFYNDENSDQADFTRVGLLNRNIGVGGYANLSDAWLYDTGHPRSPFTQQQFDDWYNCCSSLLTNSFNSSVSSQNGYGLVMLNDEAWTGGSGGGFWTSAMYSDVFNLYNSYRTSYPNSQLYPWGVQGYTMELDKSGSYGTAEVWDQWQLVQNPATTKSTFDATYPCGVGNYGCETGGTEVDVTGMYTVGNYFNSYTETQSLLFDAIHGFILGERFRPTLPGVINIWTDLETIGDNSQGMITGVNNSGRAWRRFYKTSVFPSVMYNSGALSAFFHTSGGFIMWDYPNVSYTNNPDDWFEGFYLDNNSVFVSNQNTNSGALPVRQYANKSKQNIDEFMKGYWSVNRNNDLMSGDLDWCRIDYNNDGTYETKQNSFYGAALQYKRAFAAIRVVGNEALIYAADFYGDTEKDLKIMFTVNGTDYFKTIPLKADWASIVRVSF